MDLAHHDLNSRRITAALWFAVLGPPILWALRFGVNYGLMPLGCTAGLTWLFHLVSALALVLLVVMGLTGYRFWKAASAVPREDADDLTRRTRFMGLLGMLSAALFVVVVIAEALAIIMIHPCLTSGPIVPH